MTRAGMGLWLLLGLEMALGAMPLPAAVKRVILFKFDGVNADLLDKWMAERNPQTGRSQLPWMEELFARQGTRFDNFYVRGISLSAPSWSMLDSGYHQVLHGNVEYDRWTLEAYDYLNFFPFYVNYAKRKQVDMPGTEVLDDAGIPLILDRFAPEARYQSFQLYQRGNQWSVIERSVPHHFHGRSAKEIFDEWQTGVDLVGTIPQEAEQQVVAALADEKVRYLDFFSGDYDHVAHLTNDPGSQLRALQGLDALIGRIWTAAAASPLGPETMAVMVSDHGMNTDPAILSQGYSLVEWFNSIEGGAQHVITDRYPLSDFRVMGLNPFVHKVTTASADSWYLKGEAQRYPTVALDLDGNERAAVSFRASSWNRVQVLLEWANREAAAPAMKAACRRELARWAESRRAMWQGEKAEMEAEIGALGRAADAATAEFEKLNRKWTPADRVSGAELDARREAVRADDLRVEQKGYQQFVGAMDRLLAMPADAKMDLVPKESFGDPTGDANSLYDLQNYVVGPAEGGLVVTADGEIDGSPSFRRVNYFDALEKIRVRNPVAPGVATRPVDFIAMRLDRGAAEAAFQETGLMGAVWLSAPRDAQAVVLFRGDAKRLAIRYLPVRNLTGRPDGTFTYEPAAWAAGLPLELWEDTGLACRGLAGAGRAEWLGAWHSQAEWREAIYRTRYTDGLIGLTEQFRPEEVFSPAWAAPLSDGDRAALLRLEQKRRRLANPDVLVMASDHWNFNARNFNPGGNHGSFFRQSTHAVLMFVGGRAAGIPRGLVVEAPYDSLDFAPTILRLLDLPGVEKLPGAPIAELVQ